jgi:hypothetical protein
MLLQLQNKFLLKIPSGQVSVDAKRGHIFLIQGDKVELISKLGTGMNSFLKEHLPYKLLKYFPETKVTIGENIITIPGVNVDNNFIGVGLHGVFDNRFDRIIISKLDYVPLSSEIKFDPYKQEFYIEDTAGEKTVVELTDPEYFCNKSFTLSYNLNTQSWISFHSYIPNYYVAENNFFYSGSQACCTDFDYICGTLVDTPTTTTTTTIFVPICTPLMGTAIPIIDSCTPLYGQVTFTDCVLSGTGEVTVPPACVRPEELIVDIFVTGYTLLPATTVDTTISAETACAGISWLNDPTETYEQTSINVAYASLTLGNTVYIENNTTDCETTADGWYFTDISANEGITFHVVGGMITQIVNCNFVPECEPLTGTAEVQ